MDIDQLQGSWDEMDTGPGDKVTRPGPDSGLEGLLEERTFRSKAPLRRMKRTAIRHALVMLVLFILAYTQIAPPFRFSVALLYGVIIALFSTYYYLQYRLLISIENAPVSETMLVYVQDRIRRLKGLLLFYKIASVALLPVAAACLLWARWTYQRLDFYDFPWLHLHQGQEGLVIICWGIPTLILMILSYLIIRYQTRRSYGRYLEILQNDLDELADKQQ
jgi:hypothetical protein